MEVRGLASLSCLYIHPLHPRLLTSSIWMVFVKGDSDDQSVVVSYICYIFPLTSLFHRFFDTTIIINLLTDNNQFLQALNTHLIKIKIVALLSSLIFPSSKIN